MRNEILILVTAERELRAKLAAAILAGNVGRTWDGEDTDEVAHARRRLARLVAGPQAVSSLGELLEELEVYASGDPSYRSAVVQAELAAILAGGRESG